MSSLGKIVKQPIHHLFLEYGSAFGSKCVREFR